MTDAALVQATLGGNHLAFGELIRRYQAMLLSTARLLMGNQDDAEDMVQEACIKAYRALTELKNPAQFRSWVFTILRRTCLNFLERRRGREVTLDELGDTLAAEMPTDDSLVLEVLDRLPIAYREVLVGHYLLDLSYDELAMALESTPDALRARCYRARAQLRQRVDEANEQQTRLMMRRLAALVPAALPLARLDAIMQQVQAMPITPTMPTEPATPWWGMLGQLAWPTKALLVAGGVMVIGAGVVSGMTVQQYLRSPMAQRQMATASPWTIRGEAGETVTVVAIADPQDLTRWWAPDGTPIDTATIPLDRINAYDHKLRLAAASRLILGRYRRPSRRCAAPSACMSPMRKTPAAFTTCSIRAWTTPPFSNRSAPIAPRDYPPPSVCIAR